MKKTLLIFISILAISCTNDDKTPETDKTSINLVTGVNFRQTTDDMGLKLGNPNTLVNKKFLIYPNPARNNNMLYISAQGDITEIWFVPATPEKVYQSVDFSTILKNNLYSEQSIISSSELSFNELSTSNPKLDIKTLDKGYYKIFVKIEGTIYWDNLYVYTDAEDNEEDFNKLQNFWK
ncbi:hypothetical protein [Flavobacterium sp. DG2-3]|uniref:hypothetical protein n=1 Tax=Flavobacterium sp. DG2-3 TaxID=3068317 RepID=UPI00273F3E9C|nr:hypothetical protein [Flavobacterium sp. DG2-3]MDP5201046.1 hypothetical protein [Flavobacterium sp. DG2-3]